MKTLKISDGDLVIVTCGEFRSGRTNIIVSAIRDWIVERHLLVKVVICDSGMPESNPEIIVLTVNDVFQSEVLDRV